MMGSHCPFCKKEWSKVMKVYADHANDNIQSETIKIAADKCPFCLTNLLKTLARASREDPNSIEISSDDTRCPLPESMLCSDEMNVYIQHLQEQMLPIIRPRDKYHIFNTYFFNKLEACTQKEDKTTCFLKLRRWWKGVDIFQKAYILLPVHAEKHWSLVIVCMPSKEDQTGPIILHLDSLKLHNSKLIFSVVSSFLEEEWKLLNENVSLEEIPLRGTAWKNLPCKIQKRKVQ